MHQEAHNDSGYQQLPEVFLQTLFPRRCLLIEETRYDTKHLKVEHEDNDIALGEEMPPHYSQSSPHLHPVEPNHSSHLRFLSIHPDKLFPAKVAIFSQIPKFPMIHFAILGKKCNFAM
jgi:hypothetical protein